FLPKEDKTARVLDLPPEVLADLKRLGAVLEKAGNPTQSKEHDNFLVQPHPVLKYALRPNIRFSGDVLRTRLAWNLAPPILYMPLESPITPAVAEYLRKYSRLRFTVSINSQGQRLTVPTVSAPRRVLMVGDSVTFGVGVDDADTIASRLQRRLGDRAQVINAGVGGYDGRMVMKMAEILLAEAPAWQLVYIACQNDFMVSGEADWRKPAAVDLATLAALASRSARPVIVVLHEYLAYFARDLLGREGWPADDIVRTDMLRQFMREECQRRGFIFLDWHDILTAAAAGDRTIFACFAFYTDHGHLSPRGNDLLAEALAPIIAAGGEGE
ncbi:MAG: SGNH/GDSL hydrolase family protein, partial [Planctomycetota bacterium]|nr:SGNH/GDSL hydrolase family protein [Planctomycetota bacterium]